MAVGDIAGVGSFFESFNFSAILSGFGTFFSALLLLILAAGIVGVWYLWKGDKRHNKVLHFFEEVHGQPIWIESFKAVELIIPKTNISVFYIKKKDMYLPRPVKKMGFNIYWYFIRNNRELVNFTIKNMNKEFDEAGLSYDHTDMRYAQTNLRALIQRNYRDKATTWWKEYQQVIATVIFIFVMTISFFFIASKVADIAQELAAVTKEVANLVAQVEPLVKNSGVSPA